MSQRTVKLGSLAPGVNNRLEPTQLSTVLPDRSKGTYLYAADNVDLNDKGYLKRRAGQTQVASGRSHSIWADRLGGYVVVNGELSQIADTATGFARTLVRADMPQLPVSYSRGADGDVYWSNGQTIRRITDGVDRPIASTPPPDMGPTDVVVTTGGLPEGRYIVARTNITVDGESPANLPIYLDLPANSGLLFAGTYDTYITGPNGDILTHQGRVDRIYTRAEGGQICQTLNTAILPPGTIVRHYNGRTLVVSGAMLYYSLPYYYGVYDPSAGYIPFPEPITVVEPTDGGVYICADKTYWLADFEAGSIQQVLPYGGIAGTGGRSPTGNEVFWQSPRGLVVGDKNMSVKNVQEEALMFSPASSGASLFREKDGMTHIVTSRAGAQPVTSAASSYADAEVVRQGTTL